jgi:iron-sulfur cluster assembly accessory protein
MLMLQRSATIIQRSASVVLQRQQQAVTLPQVLATTTRCNSTTLSSSMSSTVLTTASKPLLNTMTTLRALRIFSSSSASPQSPSPSPPEPKKKKRESRVLRDRAPITITPKAALRIEELLESSVDRPIGVRIGVRKRGCNGLSFTLNYVVDKGEDQGGLQKYALDSIVDCPNGVKVYVDPKAIFNIVGTVMDWKEDEIVQEFTFENPNSKGSCGCGESFNT